MNNEKINVEDIITDVAAYIRKSRGDLEEDLIKHKTMMIEICEKYGWRYVLYEEIGTGDTIESRSKMKQLLKDLDDDLYDAVVVMDFDRLGRGDEEDQGIIKKNLLRNEVFVVECSPFKVLNLYDENDMQVVEFKGFLARQEYKLISKRLNRGKKIGAKLGNFTNGIPPFPYIYDASKKGLVIDEEKYKVYRDMMDKLFSGYSCNEIAEELNKTNYPSPRSIYSKQKNAKWHGNTINNILTSEIHLGKIISNKSKYNKYKKERIEIDREEWVVVENCHEKCKTEEEHKKILSIIYRNRKDKNARKASVNMYTGLIKCYKCESTLPIQKRKNGNYSVRKCPNCHAQGGDVSFLEDIIIECLSNFQDNIENIKEYLVSDQQDKLSLQQKLSKIEYEIHTKEQELKRIQKGYIEGFFNIDEAKENSLPIKKEIEILVIDKQKLEKELSKQSLVSIDELIRNYVALINKLPNVKDEKEKNLIYKQLIDGVYWDRNKDDLEVYIELKQGLN